MNYEYSLCFAPTANFKKWGVFFLVDLTADSF